MKRSGAFLLLMLPILLVVGFGASTSGSAGLLTHGTLAATPSGSCTGAGTDDGVYGLTGLKFPSGSMTFKTKQSTFPTYLSGSEVQSAVNSAFAAWDAATSKALFVNGGTTSAKANTRDGVNTVAFGSVSGAAVGMAYAWYDNKTKVLTEFDITLNNSYVWATNIGKTGDCGGVGGAFDVRNITTHEVGHPVGLNDLYGTSDKAQTMYGYASYQELSKRTLANGDKKGVLVLFGP